MINNEPALPYSLRESPFWAPCDGLPVEQELPPDREHVRESCGERKTILNVLPILLGSMRDTNLREPGRQGARPTLRPWLRPKHFCSGDH